MMRNQGEYLEAPLDDLKHIDTLPIDAFNERKALDSTLCILELFRGRCFILFRLGRYQH